MLIKLQFSNVSHLRICSKRITHLFVLHILYFRTEANTSISSDLRNRISYLPHLILTDVPSCLVSKPIRMVALPGETVKLRCEVQATPKGRISYDWWTTDTDSSGAVRIVIYFYFKGKYTNSIYVYNALVR